MGKISYTNILIIIILLLSVGVWYFYNQNASLTTKLEVETQNRVAQGDSIRKIKTKNGDLVFQKAVLISEKKELKNLNKNLYNEVDKLDGKIIQLTSTIIKMELVMDTIVNNTLVENGNNSFGIVWSTDKKFGEGNRRFISGVTNFKININPSGVTVIPINTIITRDYLNIAVLSGLKEYNGIIDSFFTTKFPGIEVTKLDTAILGSNKFPNKNNNKKIGLGFYTGFGGTYNPFTDVISSGFQFGAGITFKPF